MLSAALLPLQNSLLQALKEAYMTQFTPNGEAGKHSMAAQSDMEQKALDFATKAAPAASQAIYDFVKEIGITITVSGTIVAPPLPPALPGGPATGVISPMEVSVM